MDDLVFATARENAIDFDLTSKFFQVDPEKDMPSIQLLDMMSQSVPLKYEFKGNLSDA